MASISSLSGSSSASSIYGNRNVISGLASGLDTETLIENAVSGFKNKITSIQQQQQLVQWKQDAYRGIIDKMVQLNRKYTSYTSSTNLFSPSFFNKAVTTSVMGDNASAVSATGRTNSDVKILNISKLASAAQYKGVAGAEGSLLAGLTGTLDGTKLTATASGELADLSGTVETGALSGSMSIKYGSNSVYISFNENDVYKDAEELAAGIREKLGDTMVKTGSGEYVKASDRIDVKVDKDTGKITFADKSSAGNAVNISNIDKDLAATLGVSKTGTGVDSFSVGTGDTAKSKLINTPNTFDYLSGKSLNVTLNGKSKSISLKDLKDNYTKVRDKAYNDALEAKYKEWGVTADTATKEQQKEAEDAATEALKADGKEEKLRKEAFTTTIQEGLDKAFGKDNVKVGVETVDGVQKLNFTVDKGDTISVTSDAKNALGLGDDGLTTYLNTSKKLGDLLQGDKAFKHMTEEEIMAKEKESNKNFSKADFDKKYEYRDIEGEDGKTERVIFNKDGTEMFAPKTLEVNGQKFEFDQDTTLESLMSQINGNKEAGVNISYSKLTNQFSITATEEGTSGSIDIKGDLAGLFGKTNDDGELMLKDGSGTYSEGTDAEFEVEINGEQMKMTRSSNTVDFDGMSVTLKKTFGYTQEPVMETKNVLDEDGNPVYVQKVDSNGNPLYRPVKDAAGNITSYEPVYEEMKETVQATNEDGSLKYNLVKNEDTDPITFETKTDTDKIVDAIQSFVNDYNELVTEVRKQYATTPAEKSTTNHTRYMPLTDEDKEGMSESAIAAYEEKVKQGLLFGQSDLAGLHNALRDAISFANKSNDSSDMLRLSRMGISTSYSNGLTTLDLDVNQLRETLESDPDSVRDIFTKSVENGAKTDGLMQNLQKVMNTYANTSTGSRGILIQKAGSQYAPTSINDNELQTQYDNYSEQIEKWQTKMSDRVDYYTRQFTALEQLMSQMNNQSSMLSGLMGGSSY